MSWAWAQNAWGMPAGAVGTAAGTAVVAAVAAAVGTAAAAVRDGLACVVMRERGTEMHAQKQAKQKTRKNVEIQFTQQGFLLEIASLILFADQANVKPVLSAALPKESSATKLTPSHFEQANIPRHFLKS